MKNNVRIVGAAVALVFTGQVLAATSWTLATDYGSVSSGVSVTAYANTGGTTTSPNADSQTIQSANWNATYGGIANADQPTGSFINGFNGERNCAGSQGADCDAREGYTPEHAIDNDQRYDMALLSFTSSVMLTELKLGYAYIDSDVTVMAYTGTGDPTATGKLVGNTYANLVNLGWEKIGNYATVGTASPKAINSAGRFSSYWLVGAYNPLAAGATNGLDTGNDYVKLASVNGTVCTNGSGPSCTSNGRVSEPDSLALLGFAMLGMLGLRSRRRS